MIDDQSEVMLINEDGTALTRVTDNSRLRRYAELDA